MSIVKSFSVGDGDMYYIKHNSDNFTIIDSCMSENSGIIDAIKTESTGKGIVRFISTHPDGDHIRRLVYLDDALNILNFYCVDNEATKPDATADFDKYCTLRDSKKAFYLYKGCSRRWMNQDGEGRGNSGINILWPITTNEDYKSALSDAKAGESPNNISCIVEYSLNNGVTMLWMGDLETDFMESVQSELTMPSVGILFAPHHGRDVVPKKWLDEMDPQVVIIGEAPSENLNYYPGYNTITQNSAGDITFECVSGKTHIYVSDKNYSVDFLDNEHKADTYDKYIGTLSV